VGLFLKHGNLSPAAWVRRFAPLIVAGGTVLDVACGSGRHVRWLAAQGLQVTGVDRDEAAVAPLRGLAEVVVADIETGPWPLPGRRFDGLIITNYLWRALWPDLLRALADGGVLIAETFANGQQHIGKPSRPEFLLNSGELLSACAGLRVVAFEDGFDADPGCGGPRYVQRIVAVKEPAGLNPPRRYGLADAGLQSPAS
jgi:SAM-dependent methyltransferase